MGMIVKKTVVVIFTCVALTACAAQHKQLSPEELVKRQARSVHLYYAECPRSGVDSAVATVTVRKSCPGSYFAALVWDTGYCGIQDLAEDARVVIFSVWDPVDPFDFSAKPDAVKEELRAKVLYADPVMDVARFGGEGTGARTMAGFSWKENVPVSFKVDSEPDGEQRTKYTCSIRLSDFGEEWYKLATISTIRSKDSGHGIKTLYSFVEDFRRDYESAKNDRRAEFSDINVLYDGKWHKVNSAFFSADDTPSKNIDAGKIAETGAFFLATGGATTNATTTLWQRIE